MWFEYLACFTQVSLESRSRPFFVTRIGGAIFALFLNFEPVIILLLAWVVIGEELSSERIGGIALVVMALFLSHWKVPRINS